MDADRPGARRVTVIRYDDLPEPGMLTALTYGLSLAEHPEWRLGRPELCISVRSQDPCWGYAIGHLATQMSGECAFCYGDTLNFNERISEESAMTAFVVFAPAVLDRADFTGIDVGDRLPINIAGMYPIHDRERLWIREQGLEAFWQLEWDPYDVTRQPAV
ncbi:MAG: suppressor of fused domain protein [Actinobacteria bacterium]|nr:suppressor of fused domain protein [Actinomycetota bacterium]